MTVKELMEFLSTLPEDYMITVYNDELEREMIDVDHDHEMVDISL